MLLVIAIGVVMALEQLGLATTVVLTAFAITFGALMLGLADRVRRSAGATPPAD